MGISKASADWQGGLKDGHGNMHPEHGADEPFSLNSRFQGDGKGSNPEELIGAALAGCYSMALTGALTREGLTPTSVHTDAAVRLEKEGDGFSIRQIDLTAKAQVPGLDAARFQTIALETKKTCPVSKALAGTKIELNASLA